MLKKGVVHITHVAATTGGAVKLNIGPFNALIIHHYIDGATTGGYVFLKMSNDPNGQFIAHHEDGANIKSADSADNYTSLFKGLMDCVEVTLNVSDGTHYVICQPLMLG